MMLELPAHPDEVTLATAVNDWLDLNLPPDWRSAVERSDWAAVDAITSDDAVMKPWFALLGEAGLAAPTWPQEYGGLGLGAHLAAVVVDEVAKRGGGLREEAFIGVGLAGPTILRWGTDEQKREHLPRILRGESQWCQLFSEPGAGSDLASLSTRAEVQGDGSWVVNGQKVWSSYAHLSDYGLLMTRSNITVPKHRGITYFLLDMLTPGVEVRPLRQMTGQSEFNEIFLSDVHIPDDARLGEVDHGWEVAITTLMNERSGLSGRPAVGEGQVEGLAARAVQTGAWEDAVLRDRLLRAFVAERALQMTTVRAFVQSGDASAGAEGSLRKLAHCTLNEELGMLATEIEPLGGLGSADSADGTVGADLAAARMFLGAKTLSIAGGTSEIQRNIIGERLLGLPRDRDPQVDVAFAERRRS
jgi:alkylation response protein AidB-like acyl-CoA dehydrogenase